MTLLQALVLGLVEGLTEYLPVSSTGHLIVAQRLLGIPEGEAANAYAIAIQAGAIVAVLGLYRQRVGAMANGALGRDAGGRSLLLALVVAFVPAAFAGLFLDDWIESKLFGMWPVVAAWTVGGIVLLVLSRRPLGVGGQDLLTLQPKAALIIGLCQCLALWPGVSRSLATILGGILVGLSMPAAVEFSFLLGLVTLGAATAYKGLDSGPVMLAAYGWGPILVGFVAAWVSAVLAIRGMVAWLQRRGLGIFGVWRILAAGIVAAGLLRGWW